MDKKFKGKIDGSTIFKTIYQFIIITIAFYLIQHWKENSTHIWWILSYSFALLYGILTTYWTTIKITNEGLLKVNAGFSKVEINIDIITAIETEKSWIDFVFNSNVTSLDQLKITYGENKEIVISPKDKDGFMKALQEQKKGLKIS